MLPPSEPLVQFLPPAPPDFEGEFDERKGEVTVTVGKVPKAGTCVCVCIYVREYGIYQYHTTYSP